MKLREFGKFAFIAGVLAFLLLYFVTGPMVDEAKRNLNIDIVTDISNEFSGKSQENRNIISTVGGFNKLLLGGGILLCLVGTAAWIAADK